MFFLMAIGGMVCTALSVSGQAITDLKTGYWIGSTPARQERVKFLGVVVAAAISGLTIAFLAVGYQFGEAASGDLRPVLVAPQASIMKALVEGFMSQQPVTYLLFGAGAAIAVVLEMLKVPALTFALGMYLPLELNTPALVGGAFHHWLTRRADRSGGEAGQSIRERGVIIASGLMAGGALGGVLGAALRLLPGAPLIEAPSGAWQWLVSNLWYAEDRIKTPFYDFDPISQTASALGFAGLCLYLWRGALRREKAE